MGDVKVRLESDGKQRRAFMRRLLTDLRALEQMIQGGRIETGTRRIGAEQEFFLIEQDGRPANVALEMLDKLDDPAFTTELALFNLELNMDPLVWGGSCLRQMETTLVEKVAKLRTVAAEHGVRPLMAGILPTLRQSDMTLDNMTPMPRYRALNEAMTSMRGSAYEFHIRGLDELLLRHDSVMLEACNASFQVHFQTTAEEFAELYNIAQLVAAPCLAAAANSPLLFGRQLWRETRIALFQQAVDTRSSVDFLRERSPRVTFGRRWIDQSVLELYQEDITRFRTLVLQQAEEDSLEVLADGGVPKLRALATHNGTVYRWNRACYGMTDGVPHLRIENRVLPSGPTCLDEVANAALWFGMISELFHTYRDIRPLIAFEDAKLNFTSAARLGLSAQLLWLSGETMPAAALVCDRLLPVAQRGLERAGIDSADIDRYLGVIEQRVGAHRNGAQWMVQSLAGMRGRGSRGEQMTALTEAMAARQETEIPVAEWEPARIEEAGGWRPNFHRVEQFMSTDLFTVGPDESVNLVASLMEWERIRYVPVEDSQHHLVGLVTYRALIKLMSRGRCNVDEIAVSEIMIPAPRTIHPDATTLTAISMMREHGIGCLPVTKGDRLVGVVTERDLMDVAAHLLEKSLGEC